MFLQLRLTSPHSSLLSFSQYNAVHHARQRLT